MSTPSEKPPSTGWRQWLKHLGLTFCVYLFLASLSRALPDIVRLGLTGWMAIGIVVVGTHIQKATRRPVPESVHTLSGTLKFVAMILCWPVVLFKD